MFDPSRYRKSDLHPSDTMTDMQTNSIIARLNRLRAAIQTDILFWSTFFEFLSDEWKASKQEQHFCRSSLQEFFANIEWWNENSDGLFDWLENRTMRRLENLKASGGVGRGRNVASA